MPLLSILIPAKGRPDTTRDAVFSAIHQNFDDFDVTLSNNGADPAVKAAVAEFMCDPRFHYIEQRDVLDMPSHWDLASRAIAGDYLLILTNRCVLKQGVLLGFSNYLKGASGNVELVSWRYDSYDNASGLLSPCPVNTSRIVRLRTSDELERFAEGMELIGYHSYTLPRGMNSCVSRSLVERIRDREGHAFRRLIPDVRFAFSCLLNASELIHFDEAFYISQGSNISTGDNQIRGDFRLFLNSLGRVEPWEDVPIKAPLVFNAIAQDFLATLREYGRSDIRAKWDRSKYYTDCLMEIRIKRKAGILGTSEIDELTRAVERALQKEDERVRASVVAPITGRMLNKIKSLASVALGPAVDFIRAQRYRSGGQQKFRTVLEAAGFQR